jgi:hypothetical protein
VYVRRRHPASLLFVAIDDEVRRNIHVLQSIVESINGYAAIMALLAISTQSMISSFDTQRHEVSQCGCFLHRLLAFALSWDSALMFSIEKFCWSRDINVVLFFSPF